MSAKNESDRIQNSLKKGLSALNIQLSSEQEVKMLAFVEEFRKWNRVHNLSAIDEPEEFVQLHLMDSLAVIQCLKDSTNHGITIENPVIADLGAGGGLPGIPLAIAMPEWTFVLIEAVKKKAAFLQHVKGKLKLSNVEVVGDRIESFSTQRPAFANATISRAFSDLKKFVEFSSPLLKNDGVIFAMKSQKADEEINQLPDGWSVTKNVLLQIPGLEAKRCLLTLHSVRK